MWKVSPEDARRETDECFGMCKCFVLLYLVLVLVEDNKN